MFIFSNPSVKLKYLSLILIIIKIMHILVERKPVVTLTASATSTIVEEFVQLLRRFHTISKWTEKCNVILSSKLAAATDFLSHPSVSIQVSCVHCKERKNEVISQCNV